MPSTATRMRESASSGRLHQQLFAETWNSCRRENKVDGSTRWLRCHGDRYFYLARKRLSVRPSVCRQERINTRYVTHNRILFPLALWMILIVIRFTPSSLIVIKSLSKVFFYNKAQRLASTSRSFAGSKKIFEKLLLTSNWKELFLLFIKIIV